MHSSMCTVFRLNIRVREECHLSVLYVQGLGGLHKCDNPATHDSEYNEILMIHIHICKCCHHPSFHYCTSSLCVSKHVSLNLPLLTGLTAFTLAGRDV